MKNKKAIGATVASALALALCGGALIGCGGGETEDQDEHLTDAALQATKIADFETGEAADRAAVFATDGFENGDVFNTWWKSDNVAFDNNLAELSLSAMSEKEQKWNEAYDADEAATDPDYDVPQYVDCQANYYGGEMRTSKYYGYGDYEVSMKPSGVKGTASTFFVCTGPYDKHYDTGVGNPHDEIDIEFLGYDTTFVQFNYFVNGVGGHEYKYRLGFDAAEDFHTYGFRWTEEYIVWFVDGKPVHKVSAASNSPMPSTAGRILTNYWTGTSQAEGWMQKFDDDYSGKAQYKYIATSATAENDPTVAPSTPTPPGEEITVPETGWQDISIDSFDGWENYTVDKTEGLNISHAEKPGSFACCGMDLSSNYSYVKFKITNNAAESADIRIDIKHNSPSQQAILATKPATAFNATDKAMIINGLAAGASQEVVCKIDSENVTVNQFVVFLNSITGSTATAGDITISELQGIPAGNSSVEPPVVEDTKVTIGGQDIAFSGDDVYTVAANSDKTELTVSYTDISGKSYANINGAIPAAVFGENNVFTVKIKNNGEAVAKIRLDIVCPKVDGEDNDFCNTKAEYTPAADGDLIDKGDDYQYGGADWVKIKAGGTVTAKIYFDTEKNASGLRFYIDSSTYDDEGKHTGSLALSEMAFGKEEVIEVKPTLPEGEGWTAIDLKGMGKWAADGADHYTVTPQANGAIITKTGPMNANSNLTKTVEFGANNKVHLKIVNNDNDNPATIALLAQNAAYANCVIGASVVVTGEGCSNNGLTVTVGAGKTAVIECFVDEGANSFGFNFNSTDGSENTVGNITVSELCMKTDTYVPVVVEPDSAANAELPEGEGWIGLDISGMIAYRAGEGAKHTVTADSNVPNKITISHTAQIGTTDANVNKSDVNFGTQNKMHMEIANGANAAKVSVIIQTSTYGNAITSAKLKRGDGEFTELTIGYGVAFDLDANETVVLEFIFNPSEGKHIAILLNSVADGAETGEITVSKVAVNKETPAA